MPLLNMKMQCRRQREERNASQRRSCCGCSLLLRGYIVGERTENGQWGEGGREEAESLSVQFKKHVRKWKSAQFISLLLMYDQLFSVLVHRLFW